MDLQNQLQAHFSESAKLIAQAGSDPLLMGQLEKAIDASVMALNSGGALFSCGNGGSMAEAIHLAEELSGRYRENRKAFKAVAISDPGHLTCVSNDFGYDFVFSRFLEAWGSAGDILVVFTTSGNSNNLIKAAEEAKKRSITVIAFSGKDGGKLAPWVDIELRAPISTWADRTQEVHQVLMHAFIDGIETKIRHL